MILSMPQMVSIIVIMILEMSDYCSGLSWSFQFPVGVNTASFDFVRLILFLAFLTVFDSFQVVVVL